MSKGYNLVKLFNTLQWHQVTCTIYFFDSEVCILTGAGKNPKTIEKQSTL